MKYWFYNDSNFIVVTKDSIYVGKTNKYIKTELILGFEKEVIPENVFNIPFSYIKSIENPEEENKMVVFYGNSSEEEMVIHNKIIKNEVFLFLKGTLFKFNYLKEKPAFIKFIKPQIFAILFSTAIFLWTYYLARQIEIGYEYEVAGGRQGLGGFHFRISSIWYN